MKSENPKKSYTVIPKEKWNNYSIVRKKIEQGKTVTNVLLNKNSVVVSVLNTCDFCKEQYDLFPMSYAKNHKEIYVGTGRFCSEACANLAKGAFWKNKKRNPNQFHRGEDHHLYGKDFKSLCKNTDWNTRTEEEIPLEEALRYSRVQKAIAKGSSILKVVRIGKGAGKTIKVITSHTCLNCGKTTTSEDPHRGRFCSKECTKEHRNKSASKSLRSLYASGKISGSKGYPAWNRGIKVDKSIYPDWGRGEWLKLTDEQRINRIHQFTNPIRRKIEVGGKKYPVRSKFEESIIRTMYSLGIRFEYEKTLIHLTDSDNYLPDFYLPDFDVFVEGKCLARMMKCEKLSKSEIVHHMKIRKKSVKEQKGCELFFLWYERFQGNSEGSLLNILNKVKRNPQRPEVEDNITNNTSVGEIYV